MRIVLLPLVLLLLVLGLTPQPESPRVGVDIPALIEQFVAVRAGDIGYSGSVSGSYFAPLDARGDIHAMLLFQPQPKRSEVLRAIVKQGAAAVPHLLAHLDDRRATGLRVGEGFMLRFNGTADYNAATTPSPPGEPEAQALPGQTAHAITVGDLCFVALGQIVNRNYTASYYQPSGIIVVTSPTHVPAICAAVRQEWSDLTPARHQAALRADFHNYDHKYRCIGALKRLAYYYPDTLEREALAYLAHPGELAKTVALLEECLTYDRSPRLDRVVADLLASANDNDALIQACFPRLIGRGYDDLIEASCRRRLADPEAWLPGRYRDALKRLGWTRLHVAVERGHEDRLRELIAEGANVNARARDGLTPLLLAATAEDASLAGLLVRAGANLDPVDGRGLTPSQLAVRADRDDVVRLLVSHGASVTDLLVAACAGDADQVRAFLRADPTGLAMRTGQQRTPLHLAVERGDVAVVAELLDGGANLALGEEDGATALHVAVARGDVAMTEFLLERKAPLAAVVAGAGTPLHLAVQVKRLDVVRVLLTHRPPLDGRLTSRSGDTPLLLAVASGQREIVRALLAAGAAVDLPDANDFSPLCRAIDRDDTEMVHLLLEFHASLAPTRIAPLHLAARRGDQRLLALLLAHGADVNGTTPVDEVTPLHEAVSAGQAEAARYLLARGAKVDAQCSGGGDTPLHWAVLYERADLVGLLLDHGAQVDLANESGAVPLLLAARRNETLAIARLLLERKADPNGATNARDGTPLLVAIREGNVDLVGLLLARGATVDRADEDGRTPLYEAVQMNAVASARLLLQHKANPSVIAWRVADGEPLHFAAALEDGAAMVALLHDHGADINARERYLGRFELDGPTALHIAVEARNVAVIEVLLERGADHRILSRDGRTVLDLVRRWNDPAIVAFFRKHGARLESR